MVCRDFILPEPASYVFFYAVSNLRKLLYIIQAERNGLEVVGEIRAYEKGITLDRPGWHKVLCLAAEQKADAIMVTELDRVARGMLLLTEAFTELDKRDLQLHASATDLLFTPSFKQYIL